MPTEPAASQKIPFKAYCTAFLLRTFIGLLTATYRVRYAEGEQRVDELVNRETIFLGSILLSFSDSPILNTLLTVIFFDIKLL